VPEFKLHNRWLWKALGWLTVQQAIVASSSVWIAHFIKSIQHEQVQFLWLWLFLSALILPYLPGMLALLDIKRAQLTANVAYLKQFALVFRSRISEWSDQNHKKNKTAILSGESSRVIDTYIDYIYHLSATGLNVVLNVVTLAILIDYLFFVSFALGLGGAALILKIQERLRHRLALKAQQSRINWTALMLKAWDNILINNVYNLDIWTAKEQSRSPRYLKKYMILERFSQFISIGMALTLMGPTFGLVIYYFIHHFDNYTQLAILTVVLPRLFQALSYAYEGLFLISQVPAQRAQLKTVLNVIDAKNLQYDLSESLKSRIQWDKITAIDITDRDRPRKLTDVFSSIPAQGRIVITGENGSGKTSLMLCLKSLHDKHAYYLPPKHDLLFKTVSSDISTGQQAHLILKELSKMHVPLLLLDEWDANLDTRNMEKISRLIDELAKHACVIESRHFKFGSPSLGIVEPTKPSDV
jgi:ABC-type bacteriocin/lantibiotic exporter with double-glycine peptidase domain